MDEIQMLSDQKIQDYIDGNLDDRDRAAVAAYLLVHPRAATEIETLRRQNEALRGIGQEILDEPVPARLLEVLFRDTREPEPARGRGRTWLRFPRLLEAATAIVVFCGGAVIGWYAHDRLTPSPGIQDVIASNVADLYAFYDGAHDYPVSFPPDRTAELISWIGRSFNREIAPPDLAKLSYQYRGGRLLPILGVSIGFFEFVGPRGARLAVVFWRGDQRPTTLDRIGSEENLAVRYWLDEGFSFAVLSDRANPDLQSAANAVFTFYDGTPAANLR